METSGSDAAVTYLEKADERDGYYDLEHLPPLLEDEENVSLADILSLRDSCLSEEEVWAVCAECVLALQSIRPSHLFYTLCITPDTLAFNAHGNVCFMEQLSDDPDCSFVPPEFDNTGSTFEGHIFSLGSTLSAALKFVIEPELEAELGEELQSLLQQMQEEKPEDRPELEDILLLAEEQLSQTSSATVCRKLSSIGRRVLSIESVSNIQDEQEESLEERWQHSKAKCLLKRLNSEDKTKDLSDTFGTNSVSRQQVCGAWDSSLWAEDMESGEADGMNLTDEMDCRSYNSSPVKRKSQQKFRGARGALNRSCSVPDSNNPPCVSTPPHGDISIPVSDLTEIGADEHLDSKSMWSNRLERLNRGKSCESYPHCRTQDQEKASQGTNHVDSCIEEVNIQDCVQPMSRGCIQDLVSSCASCRELEMAQNSLENESATKPNISLSYNYMTKSMLCLNEESQDEWISLRELLTHCGRRLTVNELWALCYTCLSSLQTYTDFPAYLCLDTMYVNCKGEVIFLKPKTIESHDGFFLAPEYQEHGIVTEKVCVYGVAAILWASAKFSLSPHQKLAMPRKMKRLLLEMAKRTPMERPTIVMAKKSCICNLSRQGISAETVWGNLISRVHPPASEGHNTEDLSESNNQSSTDEPRPNSGFVPMATESRLAPVPGPVPHSYPVSMELQLPEAFTSTATHFTPIILTSEGETEEEENQHLGTVTVGTADRLTKNSVHAAESCPDVPPSKANLHSEELTEFHTVMSTSSKTSSTIPEDSPSAFSDVSLLEVSLPSLSSPLSTNLNSCGIFNNYLFWQDPMTGHLSLVPVKVRAPESLHGLDINPSFVPQSLLGLITGQETNGGLFFDSVSVTVRPGTQDLFYLSGSSTTSDGPQDRASHQTYCGKTETKTEGEKSSAARDHPALQDVIDLLKGHFSIKGHLDNGRQDIMMGEYFFCLKGLRYQQFASIVKERFCDLHWDDDLLGVLHCLVNYSCSTLAPCRDHNEESPSKAVKRAAVTPPFTTAACRGKTQVCLHSCLDLNGNVHASRPVAVGIWEGSEATSYCGEDETVLEGAEIRLEKNRFWIGQGVKANSSESVVMEAGGHSAGGSDESPSEAEFVSGREEDLMGAHDEQMSPDHSEDMEDSDSLVSERLFSPTSTTSCTGLNFSPAWALAVFGEDCFSQEVIEYALNLGKHTGSPSLEVKVQEVQQQLIIETRNLKKTRNFYQKLKNQHERKNKGPESKLMLSKLKSQLEELRSKVAFLDCVKKYLEVLSVDQWGLEVSLLSSLAVCGCHSMNLQSTEDPTVLSFGSTKGKRTLQAGSPLGLMAYLYARNAAAEGFIQQFLYTYRFFCTPEELLQFIMDKFISASREGPEMSGDSERIFHRSLDLLQIWVTDCKSVDFTPKSSLVETLENFLNTEVIPVDSQGEVLLAVLYNHPNSGTLGQVTGSLISLNEEEDSVCLHSSTDDLSKKWRISRVVEPSASMSKEKTFSIAAALPAPCYDSLMHDLSNVCLQSEERLPFSEKELSALHIAQQLTLLQQEVFQGCHPVHFLKSRTQGVRDKLCSPNKNVSQLIPPAEGSSGLVLEGSPSDSFLQQLLTYAESVTNWISAEIVICDSAKTRAALLTRYLWIGKYCYEMRNFATAMQVLGGLENMTVRQLPAWKHLASKVYEILEELRAVQVFLKSDDLCLIGPEQKRTRPTLPSAHILAMHVQQLEIGAFTLTTGAYKWTKLRNIAKVVSQVHAFQEVVYPYSPDQDLQAYLRRRIARFATTDIHLLAADSDANFQRSSERQTRRIHDTLRRVELLLDSDPSQVSFCMFSCAGLCSLQTGDLSRLNQMIRVTTHPLTLQV